jgi:hypothetical protein
MEEYGKLLIHVSLWRQIVGKIQPLVVQMAENTGKNAEAWLCLNKEIKSPY